MATPHGCAPVTEEFVARSALANGAQKAWTPHLMLLKPKRFKP
jgi:hypothetical protein